MIEKGYKRGGVDKTLFIMHFDTSVIITQIYVNDIMFGSTSPSRIQEFINKMKEEFETSLVGALNIFLGLHIKQTESGIFISQFKYAKNFAKVRSRKS